MVSTEFLLSVRPEIASPSFLCGESAVIGGQPTPARQVRRLLKYGR